MERDIIFKVKGGKFHIISIELPRNVVEECADKYIKILLQDKFRSGRGEYGKLKIGSEEFEFTERILYKEDLERFKIIEKEIKNDDDKRRFNEEDE